MIRRVWIESLANQRLYLFLVLVVVGSDQLAKALSGRSHFNAGISFSWGQTWPLAITILTTGVAVSVSLWLAHYWRQRWPEFWWSHAIFVGAAFSNLIDRWLWGAVRDVWRIPGTSLYNNLADWCITVVITIWIWREVIYESRKKTSGR